MAQCEFCGRWFERSDMWPHGYVLGDEQFLCQDCWESEVDEAWWEAVKELCTNCNRLSARQGDNWCSECLAEEGA